MSFFLIEIYMIYHIGQGVYICDWDKVKQAWLAGPVAEHLICNPGVASSILTQTSLLFALAFYLDFYHFQKENKKNVIKSFQTRACRGLPSRLFQGKGMSQKFLTELYLLICILTTIHWIATLIMFSFNILIKTN